MGEPLSLGSDQSIRTNSFSFRVVTVCGGSGINAHSSSIGEDGKEKP